MQVDVLADVYAFMDAETGMTRLSSTKYSQTPKRATLQNATYTVRNIYTTHIPTICWLGAPHGYQGHAQSVRTLSDRYRQ